MHQAMSPLGVVIVTHRSADVIDTCLESLRATTGPAMRIIVVDNASPDISADLVRAQLRRPGRHKIELINARENRGFAAGANLGLARLREDPAISWFWVLNPDCTVQPETPERYLAALETAPPFSLMGGRTLFADPPGAIQSDGGRTGYWTGVCRLVNRGASPIAPPPDTASLNFISGANMVASRAFLDRAGPMPEDYFLFYEEVDWAARRGTLPLLLCPEAIVHHKVGTSTGSAAAGRAASAFANYFNYRGRVRFLARHRPWVLPLAVGFALLKAGQTLLQDGTAPAFGALCGALWLPPPSSVRRRIEPRHRQPISRSPA